MEINEDGIYAIKLSQINNLGQITLKRLVDEFGNYKNIVNASIDELIEKGGVKKEIAKNIVNVRNDLYLKEIEKIIKKERVKLLLYGTDEYPESLSNIYYTPCVLYYKGEYKKEDYNAIAIVGSRVAINYSKKVTEEIVSELAARRVTIVSGLARGIDTIAHWTAIKNKGRTIAVLGSGLNCIYPPENKRLAEEIAEKGMLISEYPLNIKASAKNFPFRNRIISALSLATIVMQAAVKSGALITAYFALEQGKEVFALPYEITSKYGKGCNELIKRGAYLFENIIDIFNNVNLKREYLCEKKAEQKREEREIRINKEEEEIMKFLEERKSVEEIVNYLQKSINEISIILLKLEMKGLIRRLAGNYYQSI